MSKVGVQPGGSCCVCGTQSGSGAGNLDIRTESSEFSLSRSLNALLPQDIKLESIQDFRSSTESAISSVKIFARDYLPPYPVTVKALDKFYLFTGQLFYVLEEHEARELLKNVYTEPQNTTLPMFCELFATAAVGSQHDDLVPQVVKQSFFQTARFYLDDCLEVDDFQTMRVLLLLAIFCVLDKRTACWKYISMFCRSIISETSVDIPPRTRIANCSLPRNTSERQANTSRIFQGGMDQLEENLEKLSVPGQVVSPFSWALVGHSYKTYLLNTCTQPSWLAGALGFLPSVDPIIAHNCIVEKDYCDTRDSITSGLQLNTIKLGVLLGKILNNVFKDPTADLDVISDHMIELELWHGGLPPLLRLQALVSTEIEPTKKPMVYLMHCTYLTVIILLTRRVMVPLVSGEGVVGDWLAAGRIKEAVAYAGACVCASKQVAKVVGLLHSERLLVRKCWMAM